MIPKSGFRFSEKIVLRQDRVLRRRDANAIRMRHATRLPRLWTALPCTSPSPPIRYSGSPPFQIHVLPQRLDKLTFVGTSTMFFAAVNLMKVAPYLALGQFSRETLGISVLLVPVAVATNFAGVWLVRRTPTQLFYKIAYL